MTKSELKKHQNVTMWEVLGACTFGAILGGFLAFGMMGGF